MDRNKQSDLIGDGVKEYIVIVIQLMIWSLYSLMMWLSQHDQPLYNGLMFMVFLYLGFVLGNKIVKSTKKTVLITFCSVFLHGAIQVSLSFLHV
jgi:hypothetical protein